MMKQTLERLLSNNLNYLIALLNAKALLLNSKNKIKYFKESFLRF